MSNIFIMYGEDLIMLRWLLGAAVLLALGLVLALLPTEPTAASFPLQATTATPTIDHPIFFPVLDRVAPGYPGASALSVSSPTVGGNITLTWTSASGATSYVVWYSRREDMSDASAIYTSSGAQGAQYDYVIPVGIHYFRVQAVNAWGRTGSNTGSVILQPTPTPTPATQIVWNLRTTMPVGRSAAAVAAPNDKIYVIGGFGSSGRLTRVDEYDPASDTWATKADMPTARRPALAAARNGRIYAFGGYDGRNYLASVEEYDPATNSWRARASMPTARSVPVAVTASNGRIYLIGGVGGSGVALSTVEEYDPATDRWRTRASMPTPRSALGAALANNGRIYAIGGGNDYWVATVEEYDPNADTWSQKTDMPTARSGLGVAAATNGKLYAVGGLSVVSGGIVLRSTVEEYDPGTDTWKAQTNTRVARNYPAVVGASNGKLYVIGGEQGTFTSNVVYLRSVEEGTIP